MSSTLECVTETSELDATRKEIADILSDAKRCDDNSKVSPELGKTAFDIENTSKMDPADNEAVYLCNQTLGSYGKSLDSINNSPFETVQAIGNSLQSFRKGKAEESCK